MRISELAAESGVPVATIKFYLRSGLLPEGRQTAPRQAEYGADHLSRLRLIRALLGPGGLSIAAAGEVLKQLDQPPGSAHGLLGAAHHALDTGVRARAGQSMTEHPRADAMLASLGWNIDPADHLSRYRLEEALAGLEAAGFVPPPGFPEMYASAMRELAVRELEQVPLGSSSEAMRYVVLGTILTEPLLLALRRLAQQDVSAKNFADTAPPPSPAGETVPKHS